MFGVQRRVHYKKLVIRDDGNYCATCDKHYLSLEKSEATTNKKNQTPILHFSLEAVVYRL